MKTALTAVLAIAALSVTGCTHAISRESRAETTSGVTFEEARRDPAAHIGQTLLLGGLVLGVHADAEGSTLEVLRYTLDRWGEPVGVDEAGSRLLVQGDRALDPALYDPGRLVTLTATLRGEQVSREGYRDTRRLVFSLGEIYLWDTPFRRGIKPHPNIYAPYYQDPEPEERANRYDPGYRPHPYTPHWIRPPGTR